MEDTKLKNILICDDDEDILFLASTFLSKKNVNVYKALTGQEAIKIYQENIKNIDLVILDNSFKNSHLQGEQILQELKKINPAGIVLISSGYPENYFKEKFSSQNYELIDGFVEKNYSSPEFIKFLERKVLEKNTGK
jgi:response regulator RpfG family c-di-GMP phosphodiesterase